MRKPLQQQNTTSVKGQIHTKLSDKKNVNSYQMSHKKIKRSSRNSKIRAKCHFLVNKGLCGSCYHIRVYYCAVGTRLQVFIIEILDPPPPQLLHSHNALLQGHVQYMDLRIIQFPCTQISKLLSAVTTTETTTRKYMYWTVIIHMDSHKKVFYF